MTFPVRVNRSRGQGGVSSKSLIVNVVRVDGVSLNSVRETRLPPPRERGYVAAYTFFYTSYSALTTLTLLTINSLRNIGRDRRKVGGQAATAIGECGSLAGRNFCPKPVPSVPL